MAKKKVYVCCHGEEKKGRCGYNGAVEMRARLKEWVKEEKLEIKVKKSGCLGKCSNCVAIQFGKQKPQRVKTIDEALEKIQNYSQAL